MEHTKGKLEVRVVQKRGWSVQIINPKDHRKNMLLDYNLEIAKANADEIVRRFNAFEDGGIVEELRTACEAWAKVESEMRDNNPCPDLALRAKYRKEAVKLTEAALAKS